VGYFNDEDSAARAYDRAVITHNHEWSRDVTVRLNFPGQAMSVSPTPLSREMGNAAAISLILAASQSSPVPSGEGMGAGMEMETPPPSLQHRSDVCNAMSPHNLTPAMALPPIDPVEGDVFPRFGPDHDVERLRVLFTV
jgi:hypothetical protein